MLLQLGGSVASKSPRRDKSVFARERQGGSVGAGAGGKTHLGDEPDCIMNRWESLEARGERSLSVRHNPAFPRMDVVSGALRDCDQAEGSCSLGRPQARWGGGFRSLGEK